MTERLTSETFKEKVFDFSSGEEWKYKGQRPAIIDFYADWCGPCKMVAPIIEELSEEYKDRVDVWKVDTDAEVELASAFNIQSIPFIMFIPMSGKPHMSAGALPKSTFVKKIKDDLGVS